jgi:inositol hexakisphosphate/diphosphoinositol-pentakisphosphate kinase
MKMKTKDVRFLNFFSTQNTLKEIKIKSVAKMRTILKIAKDILKEINEDIQNNINIKKENQKSKEQLSDLKFYKIKILQLIAVLESQESFSGINRKIQLKPLTILKDEKTGQKTVTKALFILKWGGDITHTGLKQAEEFGKFFREYFYINSKEGLLRLHSTYRHDLKVYSADEGRCQRTAAAFTKGLLMIEDDLTPILSSFVDSGENAVKMLDVSKSILNNDEIITNSFQSLQKMFTSNESLSKQLRNFLSPEFKENVRKVSDPLSILQELSRLVKDLCEWVNGKLNTEPTSYYVVPEDNCNQKESMFCGSVNGTLLLKRWMKLDNDFYDEETNEFDTSKLPDILDSIR